MGSKTNPGQPLSILLVEDEKAALDLLANILTKKYSGIALYTAINGRDGLGLFDTHRSDIVITDLNMPDMSGMHMAQKILDIKPDTKFIVITGNTAKFSPAALGGEELKIDHFIMKPINFDRLFAAIDLCVAEISGL